jgi:N-methylhydantoinase A
VLVPPVPGVASALGLLVSNLKRDYVQSHFADLEDVSPSAIQGRFEGMEARGRQELEEEGIPADEVQCERALDLRYSIQKYELTVPVTGGALQESDKAAWRRLFDERHEQQYGTRATDQPVEIVSYRLTAKVVLPKPRSRELSHHREAPALKGHRRAYFDGWIECPLYARERLLHGHHLCGPAIIEQADSTIVVHPRQEAHVDRFGNLIIEL